MRERLKLLPIARPRLLVEAFLGPRRKLLGAVVVVGVVGALIGGAYVATLHVLQQLLWPTHHSAPMQLAVLVAAGVGVALLTRLLGTPGDVELLVNNIHVLGGRKDIRDLRSLLPVSLLCIAAGGAMGPEAPLVQTTGSMGSFLAHRWGLSREDMRILTITGMAAGFTVLFGAPLGAAIFALEILHRRGLEYYEALLPAVLGSLAGYAVGAVLSASGLQPVWRFPEAPVHLRPVDLAWAMAAGAVGAAVSAAFTYLSAALRAAFRPLPTSLRPVLGGLGLGLLGLWSPYALTFGESQVDPILARRAVVGALLVAAVAKLLGTALTLSSGWRGGFIIPMFFIGVALGRLGHVLFPSTNESVIIVAMMVAINVGVTKTPLGSTLVATEMAGLSLLPTTLLAAVVALFLTSEVSLIHTQQRRGTDAAPTATARGEGSAA